MNFLTAKNLDDFVEANRDNGEALWVLHHLPKTAGSSIIQQLASCLQPNWIVDAYTQSSGLTYEQSMDLAFAEFARKALSTPYRFVAGHLERHHIQWFRGCERAKIFTFLRDPLTRTLSEYRYQQTPAFPGYRQFIARFPSFDHYLRDDTRRNPVVRALSGTLDVKRCVAILEADYVLCGITELTIGDIMADPDLSKLSAACATEGFQVAKKKGIKLGFDDPVAYVRDFGSKIPKARPSVLLDLMAKRKSEIDVINGSIPRVGAGVGVEAPVNDTVTRLVRAKERALGCK